MPDTPPALPHTYDADASEKYVCPNPGLLVCCRSAAHSSTVRRASTAPPRQSTQDDLAVLEAADVAGRGGTLSRMALDVMAA